MTGQRLSPVTDILTEEGLPSTDHKALKSWLNTVSFLSFLSFSLKKDKEKKPGKEKILEQSGKQKWVFFSSLIQLETSILLNDYLLAKGTHKRII